MTRATPAGLFLLLACSSSPAPPAAAPLARFAGVAAYLDSVVASGAAPGAVLAVSLHGRHYFHGSGRLGRDDPRRPDASKR